MFKGFDPCEPVQCPPNGSNPVNAMTGFKLHTEVDYRASGPMPLTFRRHFVATDLLERGAMGDSWHHTYERRIARFNDGTATLFRQTGNRYHYKKLVSGAWQPEEADVIGALNETVDANANPIFEYLNRDGETETYDVTTGRLLSIKNQEGLTHLLSYGTDGQLSSVSDDFGRSITFTYLPSGPHRGFLSEVTIASSANPGVTKTYKYQYVYPAPEKVNVLQLAKVVYPDSTPTNDLDNPSKTYLYGEVGFIFQYNVNPAIETPITDPYQFPYFLTGIVDENGARYATYKYREHIDKNDGPIYKVAMTGHGAPDASGKYADQTNFHYFVDSKLPNNSWSTTAEVVDAKGQVRQYGRTVQFHTAKQTTVTGAKCSNCGDQAQSIEYDATTGFVTKRVDFNGNVVKYSHDTNGLEVCRVEGNDANSLRKTTTVWDTTLRRPTSITIAKYVSGTYSPSDPCTSTNITWSNVRVKTSVFVGGRLQTRSDNDPVAGETRTWTYTYTATGLVDTIDGPRTDVPDIVDYDYYPGTSNVSQISRTVSATQSLVTSYAGYNLDGLPTLVTDPNGVVTTLTYNARGWLTAHLVDGKTTTYKYDGVGQLTQVINPPTESAPLGDYIRYEYDAAHRLTDVFSGFLAGGGAVPVNRDVDHIHFELDSFGNRTGESYSRGATVGKTLARAYDNLNRLDALTTGAALITGYTYDANRQLKRVIDSRDPVNDSIYSEYGYDALNRIANFRDRNANVTSYLYDAQDNVTEVDDPTSSAATRYFYSGFGDLTKVESPDTGVTEYRYDLAGNRIKSADARHSVTSSPTVNAYDGLNRIMAISYPTGGGSNDIGFAYDSVANGNKGKGRLTSMTDGTGSTSYSYDARGNLENKTVSILAVTKSLQFGYDGASRLASITYPSGRVVTYRRDSVGRIAAVTTTWNGTTSNVIANVDYAPFGPSKSFTFGNLVPFTRTLDADYRTTAIKHGTLMDLTYQFNGALLPDNNVDAILNNLPGGTGNETITYDSVDRIKQYSRGGVLKHDFVYDEIGNRTADAVGGRTYSYQGVTHRLTGASGTPVLPTYSYDAAGNALTRSGFTLSYGDDGRLKSFAPTGQSPIASYAHNGIGERVIKIVSSGTTLFFYGLDGELLAELEPGGSVVNEYAYANSELVAVFASDADQVLSTSDTDNDGISNSWEIAHGLDPTNPNDAHWDTDWDGLDNLEEFQANTDPQHADTDRDGQLDGVDPNPLFNAGWIQPAIQNLLN